MSEVERKDVKMRDAWSECIAFNDAFPVGTDVIVTNDGFQNVDKESFDKFVEEHHLVSGCDSGGGNMSHRKCFNHPVTGVTLATLTSSPFNQPMTGRILSTVPQAPRNPEVVYAIHARIDHDDKIKKPAFVIANSGLVVVPLGVHGPVAIESVRKK